MTDEEILRLAEEIKKKQVVNNRLTEFANNFKIKVTWSSQARGWDYVWMNIDHDLSDRIKYEINKGED